MRKAWWKGHKKIISFWIFFSNWQFSFWCF